MTKSEVILAAVENGATDEELAVLDATPESEFKAEVEEVEEIKEVPAQPDVAVTEENTASNGVEGSTDIPENDEYDFNVGVLPEVKIEGVLPEVKSEAFNFLQSDDKKEYNQNIKNFFNAQEEVAVPQLQKILGEDYEISVMESLGQFEEN